MAFPTEGWPPRQPQTGAGRSLRFFVRGVATAVFDGAAYLFIDGAGANPYSPTPVVTPGSSTPAVLLTEPAGTGRFPQDVNPTVDPSAQAMPKAAVWAYGIMVVNDGAGELEVSFDGTNVHDVLKQNETHTYLNRHESGISVRGNGLADRISAW